MTIARLRCLSALMTAAACLLAAPILPAMAQQIVGEPAEDWNALFNRMEGWTGGDGTYSVSLSGRNWLGQADGAPTLFLFSDTFIGSVNENGERESGARLVNNTAALLRGSEPRQDRIQFHWGETADGLADALIKPDTPNSEPGDWYWTMDATVVDRQVRVFALRLRHVDEGWRSVGVSLLSIPIDSPTPLLETKQMELPLYHFPDDGRGDIYFGGGILANTVEAGAPHPDGYLYVYGGQHDFLNKKLVAARIRPGEIEDPAAWRFWDGTQWQEDIDKVAPLYGRSSTAEAVVPMPEGRFLFLYLLDGFSPDVVVRIAEGPVGPFGNWTKVYHCPEPDIDPNFFVYGLRAHMPLSDPGELLVSYNVNSFDFWQLFREADIYRPRFVRLRIE